MAKIEITAEFMREAIHFDNTDGSRTIIGEAKAADQISQLPPTVHPKRITVKGDSPAGDLIPGLEYRFYGNFVEHKKYGWQFFFASYCRSVPHGRRGVIRYLRTAPFIGPAIAQSLWDSFGQDAVRMLKEEPAKAADAVFALHSNDAQFASEFLKKNEDIEKAKIDLMEIFDKRIPFRAIDRSIEKFGNKAAELIRRNAYLLLGIKGIGVGWQKAHALYVALGGDPKKTKCLVYCLDHHLSKTSDTWISEAKAKDILNDFCEFANLEKALRVGKRAGLLWRRTEDGKGFVAKARYASDEKSVADNIKRLLETGDPWNVSTSGLGLSDHQEEEIEKATGRAVGVFRGSPGTGKTYTLARLVKAIAGVHGMKAIAIVTFTGKAGARATTMLNEAGIEASASTIHRRLRSIPGNTGGYDGSGWQFQHNESNPLPVKFCICEEASMNGTEITARLLEALPDGCRLLFVGDTHQLPPVSHGAVMRDIIDSDVVGVGTLNKIHRNSGRIVKACKELRETGIFRTSKEIDLPNGENLLHVQCSGVRRITMLENFYRTMGKKVDPVWDIQVITAVNEKTSVARSVLNVLLQNKLNPNGRADRRGHFRIGDKVICRKNWMYPIEGGSRANGDEFFVANGEMGMVASIIKGETMVVLVNGVRIVTPTYGENCKWQLAYAITCHLCQGDEIPYVVTMIDDSWAAKNTMSREWFTTAMSRARVLGVMIGNRLDVMDSCKRVTLNHRKTFLSDDLKA